MTADNKSAEERAAKFASDNWNVIDYEFLGDIFSYVQERMRAAFLAGRADALRWISLKERLPANGQKVALLMADPFDDQVYTFEMRGNKFYNMRDEDEEEPSLVTDFEYWLPLPPPPEPKV